MHDFSEVDRLAADLGMAPARVNSNAGKTLRKSAALVKTHMQKDVVDARRHSPSRIRHLPKAHSYSRVGPLEYEIGGGPPGQGWLLHIFAYGAKSISFEPLYDYRAGPRRAERIFPSWFADAAQDAVLGDD